LLLQFPIFTINTHIYVIVFIYVITHTLFYLRFYIGFSFLFDVCFLITWSPRDYALRYYYTYPSNCINLFCC